MNDSLHICYLSSLWIMMIVLMTIIISVDTQRPNFRSDYRFEKAFNAFYKVHQAAEPWEKARIRCEAEGAELMVPDNLDEAESLPLLTTEVLTKYEGVYVGMHDLYSERTFVTLNGSRLLSSILDLLWEQREPLYSGGRCVAMRRSGRLFVQPCDKPLPFICKINSEKIVFKEECNSYNLNWTKGPDETCYMAHVEPQTWHDAYSTCLLGGGHLVVLDSREEAEYIKQLFKQLEERRMPTNDVAFIGFSDLFQRHHYRTLFGVRIQDSGFSDWDLKCTASANQTQMQSERCGGIRRSGLLTATDCAQAAMFFCEKHASVAIARFARQEKALADASAKRFRRVPTIKIRQ